MSKSEIRRQLILKSNRTISPIEYRILEKLASEGKLSPTGYPKRAHYAEYCQLMADNSNDMTVGLNSFADQFLKDNEDLINDLGRE